MRQPTVLSRTFRSSQLLPSFFPVSAARALPRPGIRPGATTARNGMDQIRWLSRTSSAPSSPMITQGAIVLPVVTRRATMRTIQFQQPDGAAQVAKHHQFLAEDSDPMGQVLQLFGEADRLPKAAQIFAAWRVGADTREFCVFVGYLAMEVAAKSRL